MVGGTTKEILLEGFGVTPSDSWTHEGKMDGSGVSTVTGDFITTRYYLCLRCSFVPYFGACRSPLQILWQLLFFFVLLSVHDFLFNFLALLRLLNSSKRRSFMVLNNLFFSLWWHLFYAVGRTTVGQTGRGEVSTIPQVLRAYCTVLKYRS